MNKKVKNEFSQKSKLNGVYLSPRKGESLASHLVFMNVSKQNNRIGK